MNLDNQKIIDLCPNEDIYKQGILLVANKAVLSLTFNQSLRTYFARIKDGDIVHEVVIYESNNGHSINKFHCDCMQFKAKKTICPHIVACLKTILIQQHKQRTTTTNNKAASELILNANYQPQNESKHKEFVNVSMNIGLDEPQVQPINRLYLEFKLGIEKNYVLKDITELIRAIDLHEDLKFGKDFTFQPDIHTFNGAFKKTINYLKNVYELDSRSNTRFFIGKRVYLSPYQLKDVLQFWLNETVYYKNKAVEVTDDPFPDVIRLSLQGGQIMVDMQPLAQTEVLADDYSIICTQTMLYLLSDTTSRILAPFYQASSYGTPYIYFDGEAKESFINHVIPYLEKYKTIPENIQNLYIKGYLKASLYLDKVHSNIIAKPEFTYNNYTFNPFAKVQIPYKKGRFVLREYKKENKILRIFEKAGFNVNYDHLYLDDDEKINKFIFEYLPILQKYMNVMYSDSFKTIVKNRSLKTSISFNPTVNLFEIDTNLNLSYIDFKKIMDSYRLKRHFYRLKDGTFLQLDDEDTKQALKMMEDLNFTKDNFTNGKINFPLSRAFYFQEHYASELSQDESFLQFISRFEQDTPNLQELPANLNGTLRDYQRVGFSWLKSLSYYHLGGILADDMGLGKTFQTITYMLDHKNTHDQSCHLIVCPSSLVYNWNEEIKRFAPSLSVGIMVGHIQERTARLSHIQDFDVILTSYPLLRRDLDAYLQTEFDTVILDEAQYIKNAASLNAKAAKQIKANARFALTGTPIENSLGELWSIFDFILPQYFSTRHHFKNKYENPILKEHDEEVADQLQKQIQPFILRRMKKDVLKELPDKIETKLTIQMTPKQEEIYYAYLKESLWVIENKIKNNGREKANFDILSRITHLRQLCDHPLLCVDNYDGQSAKLQALIELVRESLEGDHQVLIFSQFTSMLSLIKEQLEQNELDYYYLDGSVKIDQRQDLVKGFNHGLKKIFLISLKAGGTGLNLVGADVVIHVDPWWNPAVEQQATDRAYRIGQKNNVQVYKLITAHTIEEKIYELQQNKKDLISTLIHSQENFLTSLSEDEIYDLFSSDYKI